MGIPLGQCQHWPRCKTAAEWNGKEAKSCRRAAEYVEQKEREIQDCCAVNGNVTVSRLGCLCGSLHGFVSLRVWL